jgi:hypothetical protein
MVKFVIKKEEEEEVCLVLKENRDGGITLEAPEKPSGCILTIEPNGTLYRHTYCRVPGIETDEDGRIIDSDY